MRILVVEDDSAILESLKGRLEKDGYQVDIAQNGSDADLLGRTGQYEAVLLDLGLPEKAGLRVLKDWRTRGIHVPVIIITARGSWTEKVEGFNAGADDYIAKPFQYEELRARLRAVLRRSHSSSAGAVLERSGVQLFEDSREVAAAGQKSGLTLQEFKLLRMLMTHAGQILSKEKLEEQIYDDQTDRESNVLEVYISRLRKKVGEGRITTRRGQGYVFEKDVG